MDDGHFASCSGLIADMFPFGPNHQHGMCPSSGYSGWMLCREENDGQLTYKRANYNTGEFIYYTGSDIYKENIMAKCNCGRPECTDMHGQNIMSGSAKEVCVKLYENNIQWTPYKKYDNDIGWDLKLRQMLRIDGTVDECNYIPPGGRRLIKTGIFIAIPEGYEGQIRPRSGLSLEDGVSVTNTPGTIDPQYRNEVGVILANTDHLKGKQFKIGDRIAQLVIKKVPKIHLNIVEELDETERGNCGFGSTGL